MPATDDFKAKARSAAVGLRPCVNAYLLARTYAELKREQVDKIERQVLADDEYFARPFLPKGQRGPRFRVTEPKDSWLMEEDDMLRYHKRLCAIHIAAGFAGAAKGYCPALVAEGVQTDAEHLLLDAADEYTPGISGAKFAGSEKRQKAIDLIVGLVVNYPGYVPPEIPKP